MPQPLSVPDLIRRAGAAKIAEAAGVDRTTPYSWRNGVPAQYVARIAHALGIPPAEIRPDLAAMFGQAATHEPVNTALCIPQTGDAP